MVAGLPRCGARAAFAGLAMLLFTAAPAPAQITRIERIDVLEAAIYRIDFAATRAGRPPDAKDVTIVEVTEVIPARVGLQFGLRYVVVGEPAGATVRLNLVIKFPPQGLRDPVGGRTRYQSDEVIEATFGVPRLSGFKFDAGWEVEPGEWTFELWYRGRKLAGQRFTVVRAP